MTKQKLYDTTINLRLPRTLARAAQAKARRERRPLAEILRELLRVWTGGGNFPPGKAAY